MNQKASLEGMTDSTSTEAPGASFGRRSQSLERVDLRVASARPVRILLAEDDTEMRELMAGSLRQQGYEVTAVGDGKELCRTLAPQLAPPDAGKFDVVVSDNRMPGLTGLSVLEGLRALARLPPMILVTAFGDEETHRRARALGSAILDKPFEIEDLLAEVAKACALRSDPTGDYGEQGDDSNVRE